MNLNEVKLIGNLTRAPELTYLPSDTAVAETAIALNDRQKVLLEDMEVGFGIESLGEST